MNMQIEKNYAMPRIYRYNSCKKHLFSTSLVAIAPAHQIVPSMVFSEFQLVYAYSTKNPIGATLAPLIILKYSRWCLIWPPSNYILFTPTVIKLYQQIYISYSMHERIEKLLQLTKLHPHFLLFLYLSSNNRKRLCLHIQKARESSCQPHRQITLSAIFQPK